jgi:hypothetical protein
MNRYYFVCFDNLLSLLINLLFFQALHSNWSGVLSEKGTFDKCHANRLTSCTHPEVLVRFP